MVAGTLKVVTLSGSASSADAELRQVAAVAERRLEQQAPGYVDKVRAATTRLSRRSTEAAGVADALAALADLSVIDVDVPTASRRRSGRVIKVAVKRSTGWYLRYVGGQVSGFASAVIRLGAALDDRSAALAGRTEHLEASMARLEGRLGSLEEALGRLQAQGDRMAQSGPGLPQVPTPTEGQAERQL